MATTHYLDAGGDTWRMVGEKATQPSSISKGSYDTVIPFRQKEFKTAFLQWVICDKIKHKKSASANLYRCFKIANAQAAPALPKSGSTIPFWIEQMFNYFEPEVILEIAKARSKIHISFDGWASKHEKISVIGVVVHFINANYECVTRLIGLPELPGHSKRGFGESARILMFLSLSCITNINSRSSYSYSSSPY